MNVALDQPEARVDILGERPQEIVDDASAVYGVSLSPSVTRNSVEHLGGARLITGAVIEKIVDLGLGLFLAFDVTRTF